MAMDEVRLLNVLNRIDQLKDENMWPFKQLKPQVHPPRPKVQRDYMLEEMEWMSEDFWQERKWKKTMAYKFAHWCKEWHETRDCGQFFEFGVFEGVLMEEIKEKEKVIVVENTEVANTNQTNHAPTQTIDPLLLQLPLQLPPAKPEAIETVKVVQDSIIVKTKTKAPKIPPMILNLETDHYYKNFSYQALTNLPTFAPPEFDESDVYIESDSIVPCSKFMLADYYVPIDKFDNIPEHPMKRLPGNQRYRVGPPKCILFEKPVDFGEEERENAIDSLIGPNRKEITAPSIPKSNFKPTDFAWTNDEEDALWQLSTIYGYNWPLIELCLNSSHVGNVRHRTIWCCYEKLRDLVITKFTPHTKGDYIYAPYQSNKKDKKVKVLGLLSTFNFIAGLSKKRDAAKPTSKFINSKQVQ